MAVEYVYPWDSKLNRYSKCAYLNKSCDIYIINQMPIAVEWENLKDKIARLEAEEEAALTEFIVQSSKLNLEFAF